MRFRDKKAYDCKDNIGKDRDCKGRIGEAKERSPTKEIAEYR